MGKLVNPKAHVGPSCTILISIALFETARCAHGLNIHLIIGWLTLQSDGHL